jgi:hypothetical protein
LGANIQSTPPPIVAPIRSMLRVSVVGPGFGGVASRNVTRVLEKATPPAMKGRNCPTA